MGSVKGVWWIVRTFARLSSGSDSPTYQFLFMLVLIVAAVLVLIGVNLEDADRWVDRQGKWLEVIGDAAFRVLCGLIFLGCAAAVLMGLYERLRPLYRRLRGRLLFPATQGKRRKRPGSYEGDRSVGWGLMVVALIVGYLAFAGVFARN